MKTYFPILNYTPKTIIGGPININVNSELEAIVFDLLGKKLLRENITGRLDISSLGKGTYILNLTNGINTSTHKIIKE
ncbi:MAG: hypothetical protein CM15mP121_2490 [Bacteroidota bacterium]|nr:MAG: hypothetical protein CM15mP121_2490 [Bacteroidota bacterium]